MGWVYFVGTLSLIFTSVFGRSIMRGRIGRRLASPSVTLEPGRDVVITGRIVETDRLVESPLSGKRGVVIVTTAELPEIGPDGLPLQYATTTVVPFEIDTVKAGIVRIEATSFDLAMAGTAPKPRDKEREAAFMVAKGRGPTAAMAAIFREVVLAPGMHISVHGSALVEEDTTAERGYRDRAPSRTTIVAPPGQRLAIGDAPKP